MKQLLVMALLVIGTFSTQAQPPITNSTGCMIEYRAVCINTTTCIATPNSGWIVVPVSGILTTPGCPMNTELGYEVRYIAPPVSCTTPSYTLKMAGSPICSTIDSAKTVPPCGNCTTGFNVLFDQQPGTGFPRLTFN